MNSVLIINIQNQSFGIPGNSVLEIVSIDDFKSVSTVTRLPGSILIQNHNGLIPLIWMEGIFNNKKIDFFQSENLKVAIVESNSLKFGIIVDDIQDFESVDIKPVNSRIKELKLFDSCFINKDNQIVLILDLLGISYLSNITSKEESITETTHSNIQVINEYMLFSLINIQNCGIPVDFIERLEQFNSSLVDFTGNIPIIRYRNITLPLIFTELQLKLINSQKTCLEIYPEKITVIIIKYNNKIFGLIIDQFQDIQPTTNLIDQSTSDRPGIEGSVLIKDKIVTILNVQNMIASYLTISFEEFQINPFKNVELAS